MNLTLLEFIYGLIGCVLAILLGAWMAKKQARAFGSASGGLPTVTFADYGDMHACPITELHTLCRRYGLHELADLHRALHGG